MSPRLVADRELPKVPGRTLVRVRPRPSRLLRRLQLGRAAAQLLLEEANEPKLHQHSNVLFQPELVVRESSSRRTAAPLPKPKTRARAT